LKQPLIYFSIVFALARFGITC